MAATWTCDDFADPDTATAWAECVTSAGGKVISIAYGPMPDQPDTHAWSQHAWFVFALFIEAFQREEAERLWLPPTSDR
jgi:hypothetical protein